MRWIDRLLERMAGQREMRELSERLESLRGEVVADRDDLDKMRERQDRYVRELSNMQRMVNLLSRTKASERSEHDY